MPVFDANWYTLVSFTDVGAKQLLRNITIAEERDKVEREEDKRLGND